MLRPLQFRELAVALTKQLSIDELRLEHKILTDLDDQELVEVAGSFDVNDLALLFRRDRLDFNPVVAEPAVRTFGSWPMADNAELYLCIQFAQLAPNLKIPPGLMPVRVGE
jgi:hypothetical protein